MSDLKYLTDEERELTRCVCDPRHACDDCRPTRTLAIRLNEARAERIQYREKLLERLGLKDGDGVSVLAAVRELASQHGLSLSEWRFETRTLDVVPVPARASA